MVLQKSAQSDSASLIARFYYAWRLRQLEALAVVKARGLAFGKRLGNRVRFEVL